MQPILHRRIRRWQVAAATFAIVALSAAARADIYQWEYINPADLSQGKRQNATLAPDGAGVNAVPGANLYNRNLTMAYLFGAELTDADASFVNLTNADLRQANLTDANFASAYLDRANFSLANLTGVSFYRAALTGAEFTGADVGAAHFDKDYTGHEFGIGYGPLLGTGITLAQLYSTASYQTHDLTGISLNLSNLDDGNFAGQNLSNASLYSATLTRADFSQANLNKATFRSATLTGANFTNADVRGVDFGEAGFTANQLSATASYQAHDLTGLRFGGDDLSGWNFAGQNLTNSRFARPFNSGPLDATLTGADFTSADIRGSIINLAGAITTNLIRPNGHVDSLELSAGKLLAVRDYRNYSGDPAPFPITVDQHFAIGPGGELQMVFDADYWGSTISYAPGIPVTLGGVLELTYAPGVNLAGEIGRTIDLFDWTGVNPTGAFAVTSPYIWDLSNLYTTGEVTLTAVPEPAGLALAVACVFSLTFYCRRKTP